MRLRLPLAIILSSAAALAYVWLGLDAPRQIQVMASIAIAGLGFAGVFGWFVLMSGAPKQVRLAVAAGVILLIGVLASLFRIRGSTGDLVPIVEYRFAPPRVLPEAEQPLPEPAAATPAPAEAPLAQAAATPALPKTEATTLPPVAHAVPAPPPDHQDWPQYLGPHRSGVISGIDLATDWAAQAPRLLWRQPIGAGWAGFAVSGELAVTLEQRGAEERVIAYDLKTGKPRWSHADPTLHSSPLGGVGPRGVPAIADGQVFALGATGTLNALSLSTGKLLWTRNILKDNNAPEPEWGVAISPLVHGDLVIVGAGGTPDRAIAAYRRSTGEPAWTAGRGQLAYSSPALMTLAGRQQVVMMKQATASGHDPLTGEELWEADIGGTEPRAAQPLPLSENRVLFSIGYGVGSKVFEIAPGAGPAQTAKLVWATPRLKSKFANMIAFEGSVYGLDDGVFVCLDPTTGERRWKAGRYGHGQIILAGRHLLVQTESGDVVLIEPNPERLIEVSRFRAVEGKTWNPPAFAAPILIVRSDLEAAAYSLPLR